MDLGQLADSHLRLLYGQLSPVAARPANLPHTLFLFIASANVHAKGGSPSYDMHVLSHFYLNPNHPLLVVG